MLFSPGSPKNSRKTKYGGALWENRILPKGAAAVYLFRVYW